MPKFNVMVNRTRAVESHREYENVTAKTAEEAEEKIKVIIGKASSRALDKTFEIDDDQSEFEYSVDEADA